jgi:hypothetical protein
VSFHTALRKGASSVFLRIEEALDVPFGGTDNPLRHLGAIGLYLLWIVVGTGLYLYTVLDTGIEAVYRVDRLPLNSSSGTSAACCAASTAMRPMASCW